MNIYLFYLTLIFLIILCYSLVNFLITKFFDFKTKRAKSLTYPVIKGLNILIIAFTVKHGFGEQLILFVVKTINAKLSLNITTDLSPTSSILSEVFFYGAIVLLLIFYSFFAFKKYKKIIIEEVGLVPDKPKLEFPKDQVKYNPIFHERIKFLYELKYKKEGLLLAYDSKYAILYGKYEEGLHTYNKIIICNSSNTRINIQILEIETSVTFIESKLIEIGILNPDKEIVEFSYILEKGEIHGVSNKVITYNENEFLNNLINFDN